MLCHVAFSKKKKNKKKTNKKTTHNVNQLCLNIFPRYDPQIIKRQLLRKSKTSELCIFSCKQFNKGFTGIKERNSQGSSQTNTSLEYHLRKLSIGKIYLESLHRCFFLNIATTTSTALQFVIIIFQYEITSKCL